MKNKGTLMLVILTLVVIIGLAAFFCGMLFLPALSVIAPAPTATFTVTPSATITPSPSSTPSPPPAIYLTLNVNEFSTYTIYWKRELWESAIRESVFVEDFENDASDYVELSFPYLTEKGFLFNGDSSAQILSDSSLLPTGNMLHFRDWKSGLRIFFPNNSVAGAFSFDYRTSEAWQLNFNESVIPLPKGGNRFFGIVIRKLFPGDFVLSSFEKAQGGFTLDNISYVPVTNATAVPSPTSEHVTITASDGNINIRRGPGANYNPIGALLNGQSAIALSRNENGTWLYIPIPGTPDQYGWINATTQLTRVVGSINLLPVADVDPAEPAYIRNCTSNQMLLRPGDLRIESRLKSPNNILLIFPGEYEVFDITMIGGPAIKTISIREGNRIDITVDGSGKSGYCP
jgi:hypothetical protein